MRLSLLLMFFVTFSYNSFSQVVKRVEINGKIVVNSDDLEGVSVYNTSSNKGTITDEKGKFTIDVALNDIIEVRALQFENFTVTIDKDVLASKKVTVFLVEKINKLPEVVILPYDLTGNLIVDMESVQTFNPDLDAIYFGVANVNDFEFSDDSHSKVDNIAMRGPDDDIRYGLNVVNVVGLLLKPLFKSGQSKEKKEQEKVADIPTSSLKEYYTTHYIENNFGIPKNQVDDFISYVESNGLDYSLLQKGKEMEFLEFLTQQSKQFSKLQSGKN